jgi:uncharacterized protein HemX
LDCWRSDYHGDTAMNGLKISFAVVAFVLVQGIGVIWYISKLDSKVDQMYKNFQEENRKDVIENQVRMKLDLANLMEDVKQIKKDLRQGNKKDKEIMDQHKQLFELLDSGNSNSAYSYGD